jgi:hypothetical protein
MAKTKVLTDRHEYVISSQLLETVAVKVGFSDFINIRDVTPPINSGGCPHSVHSPFRGTPQYQLQ